MERIPYLGHTIFKWQVGALVLSRPARNGRAPDETGTSRSAMVACATSSTGPRWRTSTTSPACAGGNPILFPFSGRSYDRGEIHHWRADDGVRRADADARPRRQGRFRITRLDEGGFSAQFLPDEAAKLAYPYDYEFVVSYRFDPVALFVELQLTNHGKTPIPWSAGHHFYFTLPWSAGRTRRDYVLETTATKHLQRDDQGLLRDGPRVTNREHLDNPSLIDLIHTGLRRDIFGVIDSVNGTRLLFRTSMAGSPTRDLAVVTWTQDEKSPFYCVEPWMGPPNAPETKTGLHFVAPGQTQKFYVEISLG
ncbi:MAG: aldose epimerase [Lacunisphaera sp.]